LIYLTIVAPKLLPDRKSSTGEFLDDDYGSKVYLSEVIISPRSNLIGQTLSQSGLQRKFNFDVLELIRNKVHLSQPLADKVLNAGDILIVHSSREELLKIKDERGKISRGFDSL